MKECWPEGALRAYLDGELPPAEMQAVAAHLADCATCERTYSELSARVGYVTALMETLDQPAPVRRAAVRTASFGSWRWTGAAVALAAGLAIASVLIPKPEARRQQRAAVQSMPPQAVAPVLPETQVRELPPVTELQQAARTAPPRVPRATPKARLVSESDHFLALDDEPIEGGIVMRVTVPGSTPADIVFSPDGRARAIRLVNGTQRKY